MVDAKTVTTDRLSSDVREHGNPEVPGNPDDLKNCDLTAIEEKLLGVMYASDDWVGRRGVKTSRLATPSD